MISRYAVASLVNNPWFETRSTQDREIEKGCKQDGESEEGRTGLTPSGSGVGVSNTLAHTISYKLYTTRCNDCRSRVL